MRRRVAALAAASALLVSGSCPDPSAPTASLRFEPSSVKVGANTVFSLAVVVDSSEVPVRAYQLDASTDPAVAVPIDALPHPDFDDDGVLFLEPVIDAGAGTLRGAVDVVHGGSGALGERRVVTLWLRSIAAGQTQLSLAGSVLAGDGGERFNLSGGQTSILVTP